ncbi:MAG: hypothetical protein NTW69_01825 [Chloroflexi bacterium]|nr:hypothetical protein [Chloroflexota bacterium]
MKIIAPLWARIIVGLMGLALAVSSLIGGGFTTPGLSTDTSAPLNAGYIYNSRNASLGVAMLIAAGFGAPEAIAATMIARFMLEITDRVAMSPLYPTITAGNLLPPLIPALIELSIAIFMLRLIFKK